MLGILDMLGLMDGITDGHVPHVTGQTFSNDVIAFHKRRQKRNRDRNLFHFREDNNRSQEDTKQLTICNRLPTRSLEFFLAATCRILEGGPSTSQPIGPFLQFD